MLNFRYRSIFQASLEIKGITLENGAPVITAYKLLSEAFSGNNTVTMRELFTSGLAKHIHDDVAPHLWPYYMKNLLNDDEHSQMYSVILRMIRKDNCSTSRNQILDLCELMTKVNPKFEGQFLHLQRTFISFSQKMV